MRAAQGSLVAVAWMMGALASFTVMAMAVRGLAGDLHPFQMLFVRSAVGLLVLAAILSARGWERARSGRIAGHLGRNVVHFTGQVLWIYGITLLPLATATAIEFTTPIWGSFLAVLLLRERLHQGRWVALGLGLAGVLVILRPGLEAVSLGAGIMLACAFCFGATNAVTKWLTGSESALTILFSMVLTQTLFGAVASLFVWAPIAAAHLPWLGLLALTGLTAHYSLTRALGAAEASFVMPFDYLRLPLVALIGALVYGEAVEAAILAGGALIFLGSYYSLHVESRLTKPFTERSPRPT